MSAAEWGMLVVILVVLALAAKWAFKKVKAEHINKK